MTKFRTILLTFVRWREQRGYTIARRWQRIALRLHGFRPGSIRDGVAGSFDEPPPGWQDVDGKAVPPPPRDRSNPRSPPTTERPAPPNSQALPKQDGYFLRPGWRDDGDHPVDVANIRKAGGA